MTSSKKQYWFPAKTGLGWGWGLPTAWQGWVALAIFLCLALAGAVTVLPEYGKNVFMVYTGALCVLFAAICWTKGERPRWRWGKE